MHNIKRKTIFISGAAHDYSPWSSSAALEFVYELSKSIIKNENRIIHGFGLGIGSAVISGVLDQVVMGGGQLPDHLVRGLYT